MQKINRLFFIFLLSSLLIVNIVIASSSGKTDLEKRTFDGIDYEIVSDKWVYTEPSGWICAKIIDKNIKNLKIFNNDMEKTGKSGAKPLHWRTLMT